MSKRAPVAHRLLDMWPYEGVVRCAVGDEETFYRLAGEKFGPDWFADGLDWEIKAPEWRWFRINPCDGACGDHSWHIEERDGPARGHFQGAYVQMVRRDSATAGLTERTASNG